ncbi:MAG: alpha/beta hydrolase [Terracidiphilus sp.]|jgi:pimeloyl-ACP methyl ester carboxylesterase
MGRGQVFLSTSGATISYKTVGYGPPIIVIPGALSVAADFDALANALAEAFTVYTIERRGRGQSSPQDAGYSIAVDCEDALALQKRTQARCLFGHSYGGLIALETARSNVFVKKVAVYEPGVSVNGSIPTTWFSEYKHLLAQDKRLDAFVEFAAATGPIRAKSAPRWLLRLLMPMVLKRRGLQQKLDLLESNLREHREIARLNNTYENYREVTADVLLLVGGKSDSDWVAATVEKLSDVLPVVRIDEFPKLNHFGPNQTGPREVAQAVKAHFAS